VLPCTDGEQSFFPVYEPTQEELKARYKVAEGGPMVDHYDAKKEGTDTIRFATVDAPDPQSGRKEQVSTSLHRMRKSGDDRWKS
jgi:hypothetical protein